MAKKKNTGSSEDVRSSKNHYDVVIIGAGVAGLAAAKKLEKYTSRLLILEARGRIGGRVYPAPDKVTVDLGAEFIHGQAPLTRALLKKGGLKIEAVNPSYSLKRGKRVVIDHSFWKHLSQGFRKIKKNDRISFATAVKQSSLSRNTKRDLLAFVGGFHAADPKLVSAKSVASGVDSETLSSHRLVGGYQKLLPLLKPTSRTRLKLKSPVTKVYWRGTKVWVHTPKETFSCDKVVVAIPLALLKAHRIKFTPTLTAKNKALTLLKTGPVHRYVLQFKKIFWDREETFMQERALPVPTWWSLGPKKAFLVGWAGGPKASALDKLSRPERFKLAIESLASILGVKPAKIRKSLVDCWTHDWQRDPYARGAYSYEGVGGEKAASVLAKPIQDRLFFAGEYTDQEGANGTVEGAIASGYRVAQEIKALA